MIQKALHEEYVSLQAKMDYLTDQLKPIQKDLDMLKSIRYLVKDYLPELTPEGKALTPERKKEKRESLKVRLAKAEKEADARNAERRMQRGTRERSKAEKMHENVRSVIV